MQSTEKQQLMKYRGERDHFLGWEWRGLFILISVLFVLWKNIFKSRVLST